MSDYVFQRLLYLSDETRYPISLVSTDGSLLVKFKLLYNWPGILHTNNFDDNQYSISFIKINKYFLFVHTKK